MSNRKYFDEISRIVSEFAEEHSIAQAKNNHLAIKLRVGDSTRTVFMSFSASDHRAIKNFRTKVRHTVSEMAAANGSAVPLRPSDARSQARA